MPYKYLEEIATADVAFEAWGKTIEELFSAAVDATTNIMVEELSSVERRESLDISLDNPELDILLYNLLNELVYLKDARRLLLRADRITVEKKGSGFRLLAKMSGEALNPAKHPLKVDIKAVTLHRLSVKEMPEGWRATVVLDI
ncbi:MAG: archease [Deltaproteobacteria bacterium]|nr:archease [Deltaproteobacteria bacterium]